MTCQSKFKEKFRKEYVPSESGQLGICLVTSLNIQTTVSQKSDHAVSHFNKFLLREVLAVEVRDFPRTCLFL